MRKVTLEYQPLKWLKYRRFLIGNFPSDWIELSAKQLIAIACISKQSIDDISFLSIMTDLPKKLIKRLDDYQRFRLIELFGNFQSDKPYNDFIIPKIDCKSMELLAPKPKLHNITFGQFIYIDTYFSNYLESSDPIDMNKFIASTYLPYGQRFAEHIIDANHDWLNKVDLITREAIVINYHHIRDWLTKVYPLVFESHQEVDTGTENKKEEEKEKPVKKSNPNTWIKVFENIVGDDIINEDKYANLPIHNLLRYMTNKIKENLKS